MVGNSKGRDGVVENLAIKKPPKRFLEFVIDTCFFHNNVCGMARFAVSAESYGHMPIFTPCFMGA